MSIPATAATAFPMRVVRRLVIPLLAAETVGLVGLLTSWLVAGVAAGVLAVVVVVRRALRRASRQLDSILREELTTARTDGEPVRRAG
jgi:hypothetical protein